MPPTAETDVWSPRPHWVRPRNLAVAARICVVLAWLTELVRVTVLGHHVGGYVAVAVSAAGFALTSWSPRAGLVLVGAAPLTAALLGWDPIVTWTVTVFFVFLRTLGGGSALWIGAAAGVANFVAEALHDQTGFWDAKAFIAATSTVAGAAIGSGLRARQRYWGALQGRAREAVLTRETEANRRVAEERLRIARDLHDVMGHEIAVISVNLGIVEASLPESADTVRAALTSARSGVQAVLRETQQILEVLRAGEPDGSTGPPADVARIPELIASFRSLGVHVDAHLDDIAPAPAAAVSTAAYRTVQEMLTNAQRYSAGVVSLRVRQQPGALIVESRNPHAGAARSTAGGGLGLVGMRERVQSAGGRLEVSDISGVFTVLAVFPESS